MLKLKTCAATRIHQILCIIVGVGCVKITQIVMIPKGVKLTLIL